MNNFISKHDPYEGKVLHFKIEGKMYESAQQFITGAEIKKIAGIPLDVDLYLHINKPYSDELIDNDKLVDLAMPGIEEFNTRKPLRYTVNGQEFFSRNQFITGAKIRQQAHVPDDIDLFFDAPGSWEDHKIGNDELIDLARPGIEKFVTHNRQIVIYTNTHPHNYDKETISFEEVVKLALGNYDASRGYTITYWNGPTQNIEGDMAKGETVYVQHKMEFHVTEAHLS